MKNEKFEKNIVILVVFLLTFVFAILSMRLKSLQVKSYSVSDKYEEMVMLESLMKKDFIRKTKNGYEILEYDNLNYDHIHKIENMEIPNRIEDSIKMSDKVMENTYKDSELPEQILFNYVLLIKNKDTLENTNSLNKKLKKYNKELNFLDNNSYLPYWSFSLLIILIKAFLFLTIFIFAAIMNECTESNLYPIYKRLISLILVFVTEFIVLHNDSLLVSCSIFSILSILEAIVFIKSIGVDIFEKTKQKSIVKDFERNL